MYAHTHALDVHRTYKQPRPIYIYIYTRVSLYICVYTVYTYESRHTKRVR